jgi:glycosyltransferase involved in cell wall biosynthesis
VRADRLHVLRYGLDPLHSAETPAGRKDDTFHIGFTGQIAPHKGVHLLVQAFRSLDAKGRPLALHIHGGLEAYPHYVAHLRRLIDGDDRIHLHGRFASAQLADVLNALDVVVVPSNWYENSPLAIMEAHAAGKPVITAALGGMAELVNDGVDGLHFRADDAADLARQLQRLIDDPALLSKLTKGIVAPRNLEHESKALLGIYDSILQPEREFAGVA